jgi:hypothetical protein
MIVWCGSVPMSIANVRKSNLPQDLPLDSFDATWLSLLKLGKLQSFRPGAPVKTDEK